MSEVDHPAHYGGEDNPYEVIKVIEAWNLNFRLGNVIKYIGRPTKGKLLEDLKKARWYLDREIKHLENFTFPQAQVKEPTPNTVIVTGEAHARVVINWNDRTYDLQHPSVKRCNSTYGCVHGYHGRACPLFKDIP